MPFKGRAFKDEVKLWIPSWADWLGLPIKLPPVLGHFVGGARAALESLTIKALSTSFSNNGEERIVLASRMAEFDLLNLKANGTSSSSVPDMVIPGGRLSNSFSVSFDVKFANPPKVLSGTPKLFTVRNGAAANEYVMLAAISGVAPYTDLLMHGYGHGGWLAYLLQQGKTSF